MTELIQEIDSKLSVLNSYRIKRSDLHEELEQTLSALKIAVEALEDEANWDFLADGPNPAALNAQNTLTQITRALNLTPNVEGE